MYNFLIRNKRACRLLAMTLVVTIVAEVLVPATAWALTSGPSSPEFSSFEPVATTDMVNLFTGDFTYNLPVVQVPGPAGEGYSLSLSYHSGTNPEEEASWVGHGWTLNPGAINRQVRGIPDDADGVTIKQFGKARENWTASAMLNVGAEYFSYDPVSKITPKGKTVNGVESNGQFGANLSASTSVQYNNYGGLVRYYGFGLGVKGFGASLGGNANLGPQGLTFRPQISLSPAGFLQTLNGMGKGGETKEIDGKHHWKKLKVRTPVALGTGVIYNFWPMTNSVAKPPTLRLDRAGGVNMNFGVGFTPIQGISFQTGVNGSFKYVADRHSEEFQGYGFMHNRKVAPGDNDLYDYTVEQDNAYSSRLLYLGQPFSTYDQYMLSGEALGGSFRWVPNMVPTFSPNQSKRVTTLVNLGLDFAVGSNVNVGLSLGSTSNVQERTGSALMGGVTAPITGGFRFMSDGGGQVDYPLQRLRHSPLFSTVNASLIPALNPARTGSSSYIGHKLFNDPAVANNPDLAGVGEGQQENWRKTVAQLTVTSKDGSLYQYGLPVMARNETSLSVGAQNQQPDENNVVHMGLQLSANSGKYDLNTEQHATAHGSIRQAPYVTSYLLTEIRSPLYVPTPDAIFNERQPGITRFHYHKKYGAGQSSWYRWRTPYTGLNYQKNSISDVQDDMGTVATGEKEVFYLKAIETSTHIAYFVTNKSDSGRFEQKGSYSGKYLMGSQAKNTGQRLDARAAVSVSISSDPAASSPTGPTGGELEYLEKIVVFSKARPELPLKTVRFAYDYSLVKGLPNNSYRSGKLTLRKVWFEHEGVQATRTRPYEFVYKYKSFNEFPSSIISDYDTLVNRMPQLSDAVQNPGYHGSWLDPWGNPGPYGKERRRVLNNWVYQGPVPVNKQAYLAGGWTDLVTSNEGFDPAAWQLKQIKLPSGAEILVEYEQKDYSYVQNKLPMAMVSLKDAQESNDFSFYTLNLADLGVDTVAMYQRGVKESISEVVERQAQLIRDYFTKPDSSGGRNKIYYKFLYALDKRKSTASLESCLSEYISGYSDVNSAADVIVQNNQITMRLPNASSLSSPRRACYDYYTTRRYGKWDGDQCRSEFDRINVSALTNPSLNGATYSAATDLMTRMAEALVNFGTYKIPALNETGVDLNKPLSYLKLPMYLPKKGGGIRVKRLLTIDPGLETGDAALYGQEFSYQTTRKVGNSYEVISSGVATNEPEGAIEENPMRTFVPKLSQNWLEKMVAGEDRELLEGPPGFSLLPPASIGHSKVIVNSIHKGITGAGFTVHEYTTCQEYPFEMIYQEGYGTNRKIKPGVEVTNLHDARESRSFNLPLGVINMSRAYDYASQNFVFRVNSMHGQIKSVMAYAGDYQRFALCRRLNLIQLAHGKATGGQTFEYFQPGEHVPVMSIVGDSTRVLEHYVPGMDSEIASEYFHALERTVDLGIEFDISISFWLTVLPTVGFMLGLDDNEVSSYASTKVLRYPCILKKITSIKDGVTVTEERGAFDKNTGDPILTFYTDEYHAANLVGERDSMYTFKIPAAWIYKSLGQRSQNVQNSNRLTETVAQLSGYGQPRKQILGDSTWKYPKYITSATATTYANTWYNSTADDWMADRLAGLDTSVINALNRRLLPDSTYVFRSAASSASFASNTTVTRQGLGNDFLMFEWIKPPQAPSSIWNKGWTLASRASSYTPFGQAREEQDPQGNYKFAIFDASEVQPYIAGTFARASEPVFLDFERDLFTVAVGHTGRRSHVLKLGHDTLTAIYNQGSYTSRGALVQFWSTSETINSIKCIGAISVENLVPIASCNGWNLFEALLPVGNQSKTHLIVEAGNSQSLIDDVKVLPGGAQATAFVYDLSTYKPIAQFDEQHFATLFQYNGQGMLVRKAKETARGLRTLQETHFNTTSARK